MHIPWIPVYRESPLGQAIGEGERGTLQVGPLNHTTTYQSGEGRTLVSGHSPVSLFENLIDHKEKTS